MVKPRMTLDEFLQRLAETPCDWKRIPMASGELHLRRSEGAIVMCPITALVGQSCDFSAYIGEVIGLSLHDKYAIMNAADGLGEPALRAQLERACGLDQ